LPSDALSAVSMVLPSRRNPRWPIHLRAVGVRVLVTGEGDEGGTRECLLSSREPASRNPRTEHTRNRTGPSCARAPFRHLSAPRPSSVELRASFRLAPSICRRALRPRGGRRRAMRHDRRLPPERNCVYPYLVRSRQAPRLAPRAGPAESGLRATRPGEGMFHDTRDRFGGSICERVTSRAGFSPAACEHGPVRPKAPERTVPLTPLSLPREKPRPPGPCPRERARCVTTRGAFHRQGALHRSRLGSLLRGCHRLPRDRAPSLEEPRRAGRRSHAILGLHRTRALVPRRGSDLDRPFARRVRPPVREDARAALGPCSLVPFPFWREVARAYSRPDVA
jgi:hypothetical protein